MNDESPDIQTSSTADGASPEAPAASELPAAKKRRSKATAKAEAAAIEARIGHTFADPSLLTTAFTHVSALKKSARGRGDSYQRLEFLGDHVLGLIVSDMLYRAFPKADEGELSKRLADLVRKESCADVAKSLGLVDDIKLGSVGAGEGARLRQSVLGDICEKRRREPAARRRPGDRGGQEEAYQDQRQDRGRRDRGADRSQIF